MIVEVGSYRFPEQVGYKGWVVFKKKVVFERLDGEAIVFERPT